MINNLLTLFPDAVLSTEPNDHSKLRWYFSDDHQYVGIPSAQLSESQQELLDHLLTPVDMNIDILNKSKEQTEWYHFLYQKKSFSSKWENQHYRFILYSLSPKNISPAEFSIAIHALIPSSTIIWNTNQSGVIVEPQRRSSLSDQAFSAVIDTLSSDLYADLHLYIGPFRPFHSNLPFLFNQEVICFKESMKLSTKQKVFTLPSSFLLLLISGSNHQLCVSMAKQLLFGAEVETDLLQTVKAYIGHNSNATVTAKKLFMHRNSLNYRIDKFIEKTGINIRTFEEGIIAYLAIKLVESNQ